jgi:hypothetical protein
VSSTDRFGSPTASDEDFGIFGISGTKKDFRDFRNEEGTMREWLKPIFEPPFD